ncbi:thiamine biosynthesis protein [Coprinopsis cinerea AmutBmut pab1-1]|nr:thiamine biosynthesis protein [Coprinopsis cinerea AmutBmut pab1-1]
MTTAEARGALTIAGSDPSGGAGIQADLKTFAAHGCYGASVITSLTAQNTTGVQGVHAVPPDFVVQQLRMVLDDIDIKAIKTGMLYDAVIAAEVAKVLKERQAAGKLAPVVCDPVCVSTSGHTLLKPDALDVLVNQVFPLTTLITPNKPETELLLKTPNLEVKIESLADMYTAAVELSKKTSTAVLVKGGHVVSSLKNLEEIIQKHSNVEVVKQNLYDENMEILLVGRDPKELNPEIVVDLLYQPDTQSAVVYARPRIESTSTHGTGCTLSAAIASGLAQGLSLKDAVAQGALYTHFGIATAQPIGKGYGPLNHLHCVNRTVISSPTPTNPYPFAHYLIRNTKEVWKGYVEHEFVKQLGKGVLAKEKFVHFIKQDYHYLKYYARAYGLLASKSSTFPEIHAAATIIMSVIHEIDTHKSFCETFGVTAEELENTPESTATTAYGAFIINSGVQGDACALMMAVLSCLLGYGEVGLWLKKESELPNSWVVMEGNPYKKWIEDYSGEGYQSAVRVGLATIEKMLVADHPSPARLKEWLGIFQRCTALERGFWDMAMGLHK